jgi:nitroreductase
MRKVLLATFVVMTLISCNAQPPKKVYEGTHREAILENILTRRSIRKYTAQQISTAQIDTIMKCAIYAPSSMNQQPWEVRVVQNPKWLAELNSRFIKNAEGKNLSGNAARYKQPGFSVFHNAPTLVVIARDKNNPSSSLDCGLILENILLSAHAIGLGSCPIGSAADLLNLPENKDLLEMLNIPEGYDVAVTASLGYPDEVPPVKKRFEEKVKIIK